MVHVERSGPGIVIEKRGASAKHLYLPSVNLSYEEAVMFSPFVGEQMSTQHRSDPGSCDRHHRECDYGMIHGRVG